MKKFGILVSAAALTISAFAANVSGQKSVQELLGLRSVPQQTFESTGAPMKATTTPCRLKAAPAEGNETQIMASVIYPNNVQGMWSYSLTEWNPTQVKIGIIATGGGFAANGKYYLNRYLEALGFEEIRKLSYYLDSWEEYDNYVGSINEVATTMAYSPLRDEVYGCFINSERTGYNFVLWNYDYYSTKRVICPIERPWSGCAFSSDGTLYAIERNGDLYTVNLKNGAMTLVGSTGIETPYIGDATIDTATDIMYWSVDNDTEVGLFSVDLTTAQATKLYDLANGEQLAGMYIPSAAADAPSGAPAKPGSVSASFSGVNLNGTIRFSSPNYTVGGDKLPSEEEIDYTVRANGTVIATGKCLPYKTVSASVTLPEADSYYFTVTCSNSEGESLANGTHKFVGPDIPKANSWYNVAITGNTVSLTWTAISSTGLCGGNVDNSNVTYKVVRYPDMVVVADDVTTRTATDELPETDERIEYYYTVCATVGEYVTEEIKSTSIPFGPITPAYTQEFTNKLYTAGWTYLDANSDGYTWAYYSSDKAIQASAYKGFDDWAISPAIKVQAGNSYPVSFDISTSSYYDETFEVKWGYAPTAEAMTNTLLEATTLKSTAKVTYSGDLTAEESGKIYIGFHAITAEKSYKINLHSLTIGTGVMALAPTAVSDLTVESPVNGTCKATITFTVPTTDLAGDELSGNTEITAIDIYRDGELLTTLTENIAAGTTVSYTDESASLTFGNHTYTVVARNAYGDGTQAQAEVFVGARRPVAPESALMLEEGNTGKVTISWLPVTTDIEGNTILPESVTYRVIDRQYNTVAENVSGTSVTIEAVEEGTQAFCQFGVYAVTAGGESQKMAATAYKPVGTPYETPWSDSFTDAQPSSIFGFNYIKGNEPWRFVSSHDWGIVPQDNDGGFIYQECYGDLTAIVTGKMNLAGLENPAFVYYTYNYAGSSSNYSNVLEVQVDNGDERGFVAVQSNVVSETGPTNTWNKVVVSLMAYEGQTIIIRIEPKNPGLALYTLDNLRVSSYADFNLSATRITGPEAVEAGKTFEINAVITNTGEEAVNNYTVELYRNGQPAGTTEGTRLQPNESKAVVFEQTLAVTDEEYNKYNFVIFCDNDQIESDNTSSEFTVGLVTAPVPVATNLTGSDSREGAVLTWVAPDLTSAPGEAIAETFENAESWSNAVEGWKFVDADLIPVGGINTNNFPCTGLQSWFIADNTWTGFPESGVERWNAHSGNKFLVSEYVQRSNVSYQSDDWAISPKVYSGSQMLSLYAKSFDPSYLEDFEILASSATTSIDDFESISYVKTVPNAWTPYQFKLPEGTKYFAIRSRSYDKFMLFVDDVKFIAENAAPAALVLKGYNIYRNGTQINEALVAETTYTDATAVKGRDYTYFVTAVFDKGESLPSNITNVVFTDISGIGNGNLSVTTVKNEVVIKGLSEGTASIVSADGRLVATLEAAPEIRMSLNHGVYIVTAANRAFKIMIK